MKEPASPVDRNGKRGMTLDKEYREDHFVFDIWRRNEQCPRLSAHLLSDGRMGNTLRIEDGAVLEKSFD